MTNSNYGQAQSQKNYRNNNENNKSNFRGRYGGNRDSGGFRIRLSDNEMKSVKSIQETFQLKSTVAVLGFSVRTLSEMLNDDNLKDLIIKNAQKAKNYNSKENLQSSNVKEQSTTPNPFARPEKKQKVEKNNPDIDEK